MNIPCYFAQPGATFTFTLRLRVQPIVVAAATATATTVTTLATTAGARGASATHCCCCCCPTCNQFATSLASLLALHFVGSDGSRRELSLDLGLGLWLSVALVLWVSRRRRRGHAHHSGSKAAALTPYFGAAGKVRPWRSTLTRFLAECSASVSACLPACV